MNFIMAAFAVFMVVMAGVGTHMVLSDEHVYPADFQKATEVCSANGGVKVLELDLRRIDVTCNNGAMFDVPAATGVQS